jgi:hypothetical protein
MNCVENDIICYFYDVRNFGTFKISSTKDELETKLNSLGLDWLADFGPFDIDFQPKVLTIEKFINLGKAAGKYKRPLGIFLMDQSKTSGIGNYVLSEALYIARINPFACSSYLTDKSWETLYFAVKEVLVKSYLSQCPPSVLLRANTSSANSCSLLSVASRSRFESFQFLIYGQDKTQDFSNPVRREIGPHKRSIHWDPSMQTLHSSIQE